MPSRKLVPTTLLAASILPLTSCDLISGPLQPNATLPNITTFTADPPIVAPGDPTSLSWQVSGNDLKLTLRDANETLEADVTNLSSFETPGLDEPTSFHLTAENLAGFATSYVIVSVFGYTSE